MKIFYRISDNSYKKIKLPGTDKEFCLRNFKNSFPNADITIVADNVLPDTLDMIKKVMGDRPFQLNVTNLSNAGALTYAIHKSITFSHNTTVYFVEDDYLHFSGSTPFGSKNPEEVIEEGLQFADYVTLYDHPDKYHCDIDFRKFSGFGEISNVIRSSSTHWRSTISTCMTFATKVSKIRENIDVWESYTRGTHPHDHQIFVDLHNKKAKSLIVCIPGLAFHTDLTYPMQSSLDIDELIEPWAIDMVAEELQLKIKEKTGEFADVSSVSGFKKLILLEAYLK